jgi:hypothetical protein
MVMSLLSLAMDSLSLPLLMKSGLKPGIIPYTHRTGNKRYKNQNILSMIEISLCTCSVIVHS